MKSQSSLGSSARHARALTAKEAFRRLRVRNGDGYQLLKSGQLKGRQLPNGQWRITEQAIEEYLTPPDKSAPPRRRRKLKYFKNAEAV